MPDILTFVDFRKSFFLEKSYPYDEQICRNKKKRPLTHFYSEIRMTVGMNNVNDKCDV